jgi:hypothetical protein
MASQSLAASLQNLCSPPPTPAPLRIPLAHLINEMCCHNATEPVVTLSLFLSEELLYGAPW